MLTCETCDCQWQQMFDHKKRQTEASEKRKTKLAAKVNGQGPFCELCRHLEMAPRNAAHRGLVGIVTLIQGVKAEVLR